jgi:hypothetical protein
MDSRSLFALVRVSNYRKICDIFCDNGSTANCSSLYLNPTQMSMAAMMQMGMMGPGMMGSGVMGHSMGMMQHGMMQGPGMMLGH